MSVRVGVWAILAGCLSAQAGEIVIVQPTAAPPAARETRTEKELGRTLDRARQSAGKSSGTTVIVEENGNERPLDRTERSMRDARDYLRPGGDAQSADNATVILRAAPPSEAERMRQKARSYVTPPGGARTGKNCAEATTQVGMIGEGAGAERSANVIEKGNYSVTTGCK